MPASILPIPAPVAPGGISPAGESRPGEGFGEVFASAVRQVEGLDREASASVEQFLSGDGADIHTTVLAAQRADLAFEMFLQVRNKVVSAYQEVMRMSM